MKFMRVYTGPDGESHLEALPLEFKGFAEGRPRTLMQDVAGITFVEQEEGFRDFHPAGHRQYVLHLTSAVEIGLGDGSTMLMEPGDVLLAEDTTGHGHTSRITRGGISAFVTLPD